MYFIKITVDRLVMPGQRKGLVRIKEASFIQCLMNTKFVINIICYWRFLWEPSAPCIGFVPNLVCDLRIGFRKRRELWRALNDNWIYHYLENFKFLYCFIVIGISDNLILLNWI